MAANAGVGGEPRPVWSSFLARLVVSSCANRLRLPTQSDLSIHDSGSVGDAYAFKNRQEHNRHRKKIDCEQRSLDMSFGGAREKRRFYKGDGPGTRASSVRCTDALSSSRLAATAFAIYFP